MGISSRFSSEMMVSNSAMHYPHHRAFRMVIHFSTIRWGVLGTMPCVHLPVLRSKLILTYGLYPVPSISESFLFRLSNSHPRKDKSILVNRSYSYNLLAITRGFKKLSSLMATASANAVPTATAQV